MQEQIIDLPTALIQVDDLVGEAGGTETAVDTIAASNDLPGDVVLPDSDVVGDSTSLPAVAATGFDYATVTTDLAADLRQTADRVWKLTRAAVIDVGRELRTVKDRLEHGQFVAWVQQECQMPIRSAERAMRAAAMVEKNDNLSYLPADGLLVLGARSAPKAAVTEIRRRIDAGEKPTAAEIKREIEDAKWQAKRAAEEAAMSARRRKTKTQRQVQQQPRHDDWEQRRAERETATTAAAQLLHARLGPDVSEFLKLAGMASEWGIIAVLRDLVAEEARARLEAEVNDPTEPLLPLIGGPAGT